MQAPLGAVDLRVDRDAIYATFTLGGLGGEALGLLACLVEAGWLRRLHQSMRNAADARTPGRRRVRSLPNLY